MKTEYEHPMMDGLKIGINIDNNGLELRTIELKILLSIFKKCKALFFKENNEYVIVKRGQTSDLRLSLRQNRNNESYWYFNIDGNPIAHFKKQNVYGKSNAAKQIKLTFAICLKWLEKKSGIAIPQSLMTSVDKGLINIHSLEFAAYTKKIDMPIEILINSWQYMYRTSDWKSDTHESLDKLLGVTSRIDSEEYRTSFAVASTELVNGRQCRLVSLRLYSKLVELQEREVVIGREVEADLTGRLRIDIEFSNRWLGQKKIKNVALLEAMIADNYENDWKAFVLEELNKIVAQSCLIYMWQFPNVFASAEKKKIPKQWFDGTVDEEVKKWGQQMGINPRISYKAHVAMLHARAMNDVKGEQKMKALASKSDYMEYAANIYKGMTSIQKKRQKAMLNIAFDRGSV